MLEALKFVQGAVAKKDFVPSLTHFVIENGTVRGFNGVLALSSPLPLDIACKPRAEPLIKAIANCKDTAQLSITPAGRLSIRSGAFRALVDAFEGPTPHALPEGNRVELNGVTLLAALTAVSAFVGNDASRPWANGVLLKGGSAYATNNVTLVQFWIGIDLPRVVNIPRTAVQEMLRIGEAPTHAQLAEGSITFHYEGNRWLRTQLYDIEAWPDLDRVLGQPCPNLQPIDDRLFEGLATIKYDCDKVGRVYFTGGGISTVEPTAEGTSYDVPDLHGEGIYQIDMLQKLNGVAKQVDWTTYPGPVMFQGDNLRGAIVGMRK